MEDDKIIELFWERNETAIEEAQLKYASYLFTIADNILADSEDSEECLNDALLKAWNSIPPQRPQKLSVYLARLIRQSAIDVYRKKSSHKRYISQHAVSLDELEECISGEDDPQASLEKTLLSETVKSFTEALPSTQKLVFVGRYYYFDSIRQIASYTSLSESAVKSMLKRLREKLKLRLEKEGLGL